MFSSHFEYKGYVGTAEVDIQSGRCVGRALYMSDPITYSSEMPSDLEDAFIDAVDRYLDECKEINKTPDKPAKGIFTVTIPPYLHLEMLDYATAKEVSVDQVVISALSNLLREELQSNSRDKYRYFKPTLSHMEVLND